MGLKNFIFSPYCLKNQRPFPHRKKTPSHAPTLQIKEKNEYIFYIGVFKSLCIFKFLLLSKLGFLLLKNPKKIRWKILSPRQRVITRAKKKSDLLPPHYAPKEKSPQLKGIAAAFYKNQKERAVEKY